MEQASYEQRKVDWRWLQSGLVWDARRQLIAGRRQFVVEYVWRVERRRCYELIVRDGGVDRRAPRHVHTVDVRLTRRRLWCSARLGVVHAAADTLLLSDTHVLVLLAHNRRLALSWRGGHGVRVRRPSLPVDRHCRQSVAGVRRRVRHALLDARSEVRQVTQHWFDSALSWWRQFAGGPVARTSSPVARTARLAGLSLVGRCSPLRHVISLLCCWRRRLTLLLCSVLLVHVEQHVHLCLNVFHLTRTATMQLHNHYSTQQHQLDLASNNDHMAYFV